MSVGSSFGLLGSVAGAPLAAKGSDIDRAKSDRAAQTRAVDSVQRADAAAGIGTTQGDSETSDRDADGRRIWELAAEANKEEFSPESGAPPALGKDPTGQSGTQLDLSG